MHHAGQYARHSVSGQFKLPARPVPGWLALNNFMRLAYRCVHEIPMDNVLVLATVTNHVPRLLGVSSILRPVLSLGEFDSLRCERLTIR